MNIRHKRPDKKNALSIINAAKRDMEFTLSLNVTQEAGATIVRNIYESFRMMGDALLVAKGIESDNHILPIKELLQLKVDTKRPVNLIENLRQLRHNINYYGYAPKLVEIEDAISIAKNCFKPLLNEAIKKIEKDVP